MSSTKIPKLPRNRYNYVGDPDGVTGSSSYGVVFKDTGSGGGGGGGGLVINNTTLSAMKQVAYMVTDEKGFITGDDLPGLGYITYNDIKTVNGYSLVGTGDITVSGEGTIDLSAYATKQELASYVTKVELESAGYLTTVPETYATKAYVSEKIDSIPQIDTSSYALKTDLNAYVTKTQLESAGYLTTIPDSYATKAYVTSQINSIDLSSYATKSYVEQYVADNATGEADLTYYVSKNELASMGYLTSVPETYATKAYVNEQINSIPQIDTSSYALKTDLNAYVTKTQLESAGYLTTIPDSYATKAYVTSKINAIDYSAYVTKTELNTAGYLTSVPDTYATKAYVTSKINAIDYSSYVTKTELNTAGYLTTIPDSYATKAYVTSKINAIDYSSYVTKTELNTAGYLTTIPDSYATKAYVTSKINAIDYSSYVTKTELYDASYATNDALGKYVLSTYLDEKLSYTVSTYVEATEAQQYIAKQTDGIIVLNSSGSTVYFPVTGIYDGKTITVINRNGYSFTSYSQNGVFVEKTGVERVSNQIVRTAYAVQYIYYGGEWFVL